MNRLRAAFGCESTRTLSDGRATYRRFPVMKKLKNKTPRRSGIARALLDLWCALLLLGSAEPLAAEAGELSLEGDWEFKSGYLASQGAYAESMDSEGWEPIRVPSNWYLEGFDVSGAHWLRRSFELPETFDGQYLELHFQGVDYAADVWVNETYMGYHEGYFEPFSFDVTNAVEQDGENVVVVRVDSPLESPGDDWSLKKRLIKGIFSHHDTRPGGAWSTRGQEKNTGGIWAPVTLVATGPIRVERVRVEPHIRGVDVGDRAVRLTPRGVEASGSSTAQGSVSGELVVYNKSGRTVRGVAELVLRPVSSADESRLRAAPAAMHSLPLKLAPGRNRIPLNFEAGQVELWWTWDQGPARLYELTTAVRIDGDESDSHVDRFGFRSVEFDAATGTLRLNGSRTFLRGTNYISTQWLSEMNQTRFRQDVAAMLEANINAVRVHAHIEPVEFYRVCDEAGLLVWQDFPLQWGYEDSAVFRQQAEAQARAMVEFLFNHPSIAIWSAHNEPPWDASWMQYKYPSYDPEQNRALDDALLEVLQSTDPTRYSHRASETGEHPWFGWYSGSWKDYNRPTERGLITEFGAQALPDLDSLRRIFPDDALFPNTESEWALWGFHNFQRKETFELAGVEQGDTTEEFIRNTQDYQAKLTKLAAESYRRQRFQPVGAIFQFMFVEDWPSLNWGVVDYWRRPKAGYEALRTSYQPLLPSIAWGVETIRSDESPSALGLELWVVNDLPNAPANARLTWTLMGPEHRPLTRSWRAEAYRSRRNPTARSGFWSCLRSFRRGLVCDPVPTSSSFVLQQTSTSWRPMSIALWCSNRHLSPVPFRRPPCHDTTRLLLRSLRRPSSRRAD